MDARSVLFWLGGSPWRQRLRRLGLIALTVAAAVNFGLFAPAYRYARLEGYRQAAFDLWVNGPMNPEVATAVAQHAGGGEAAVVVDITPRFLEAGTRRTVVRDGRFVNVATELELLYPDDLRVEGKRAGELLPGEVALDSRTLEALALAVGDSFVANFVRPDGSEVDLPFTVGARYESTSHLDGSIGGLTSDSLLAVIPEGGARYSSVYLATAHPQEAREALKKAYGNDLQVFSREELLQQGAATVGQTVDEAREILFFALALTILLALAVRDLSASLDARGRAAAILIALGVRRGSIARAILAEQLMLLAAALCLGTVAGVGLFVSGIGLPVPVGDLSLLVASLGTMAATASVVTVSYARWRLDRTSVVRMLFEGL